MNIIDVKNLDLGFELESGFRKVLNNVSFSLKSGKTLAVVGESGSGKTLSAMSILRLLPKTAQITGGEIFYKSENLLLKTEREMQKIRGAKIALIPQDPMTSLNPLYTIGDQILEIIKLHQNLRGKEAEKKAIEALDAVQIPSAKSRLSSYPHEFSGGMKQRVIIAMALVCNAEVIIADEPTTALDVTIQAQIMNLLDNIKKEKGTALLLITHDLALVQNVADEVAVMYAGEIVEFSKNDNFLDNAKHPYTQALIKAIPKGNKNKLYIIPGQPPSINQTINGCKFNPRCEFATEKCKTLVPDCKNLKNEHMFKCILN